MDIAIARGQKTGTIASSLESELREHRQPANITMNFYVIYLHPIIKTIAFAHPDYRFFCTKIFCIPFAASLTAGL